MNILIAMDSNYFQPAKTMLTSLFVNNDTFIDVYLLYSRLKETEVKELEDYVGEFNAMLHPIYIDDGKFNELPMSHHFTIEAYYRFLAQSILPNSVDRVLYLDPDIIINKSVQDFYSQDFLGKHIVACQSINKNPQELIRKLELPEDSQYFNSGVILFNLKSIRTAIDPRSYFEYIENNSEKITWIDQDVLNVIYNQKTKFANTAQYNHQVFSDMKLTSHDLETIRNHAVIIHYIGPVKPWHFQYRNDLKKDYWKYARKTQGNLPYIKYSMLNTLYRIYKKIIK